MPGCSAIGCSNSAKKGFLMKRFPSDPKRRKEWAIKMKRDNWLPTVSARLCEVHFEPEMWEKTRQDGSRKLKHNAVPTIFTFSKPKVKRKAPATRIFQPVVVSTDLMQPSTSLFESDQLDRSPLPILQHSLENPYNNSSQKSDTDEGSSSERSDLLILQGLNRKQRIEKYKKKINKQSIMLKQYKNKLKNTKHHIKMLKLKIKKYNEENQSDTIGQIFNEDQLLSLKKKRMLKSTKFMKWSDDTIIKSLKLKFASGNSGYEELLNQNLPYPSIRTLQRRLQNLKFDSGILYEVFNFLKYKIESLNENQKDCVLVLDEMAITPGKIYDTSLNKYFGDVTLPEHTGVATHLLVFMLGGVNARWKQMVAYYFTGNSVNGTVFKEIITTIFNKAKNINLNIVSVTSDMGSSNQALWRTVGISAGRHEIIKNCIKSPIDETKKICFLADVPHLYKNLKGSFMSNKVISISADIQKEYNLPTQIIDASHISDLVNLQDDLQFRLAPKLTQDDLLPSHYDKMKVSKTTNVLSHDVSSALKFLAEHLNKPEYLTTAWFIDTCDKWFYLMTSRSPTNSISKINPDKYIDTIQFLKKFMEVIDSMGIGVKKTWKPCQTGILITTKSMLQLQELLLDKHNYNFVLTGRFSQDCLENLFSVLRSKQIVPNALQVKNNLKLICVSQYLKCPKGSSYDEDDREYFSNFLDSISSFPIKDYDTPEIPQNLSFSFNLNFSEINSLYNIAGYIVTTMQKQSKTCDNCVGELGSREPLFKNFTKFTLIKRYRINTLFFCHEHIFYFFVEMECIFRQYFDAVCSQNIDLKSFFIEKMNEISIIIPDCHNIKFQIIKRYVVFRLKIASKKKNKFTQKLASKSLR